MILNMRGYFKLRQIYNLNHYLNKMPNHMRKVEVVTGSSSGIEMETEIVLSKSGLHIFISGGA